jgi:hypothetical protein
MSALAASQLADLNEFGEANAWADFYRCAAGDAAARELGIVVQRVGSAWVTAIRALDTTFFNRIVGLGVREPVTEAMLGDAIAVLEKAGCRNYMAQVCPAASPAALAGWLAARGFAPGRNWAKVWRSDEPARPASTDLRIETIGARHADAYADVALAAFGMPRSLRPMLRAHIGKPGWRHFLAFDGNHPVAASAMFVDGDTAWLGFGCTLETHRGRGAQGAMFAERIDAGRALGCRRFVTETGEPLPGTPNPSYNNMLRAGFELAYLRRNHVHQPGA